MYFVDQFNFLTSFPFMLDYEGYNDVYGHSLDDDYGVSPSGK